MLWSCSFVLAGKMPKLQANGAAAREEPIVIGDGVLEERLMTPMSPFITAESSALSELLVDFTSGLLKSDVGIWPCVEPLGPAVPAPIAQVPTPASIVGEVPPAISKRIHLGPYSEKTASDLEKWLDSVESDDEGMTDLQMDSQTDIAEFQHPMTPAHVFEDFNSDMNAWLNNDDIDSDRLLTNLIPTDHLTFDWTQDYNTFQGKRETFTGIAGPTFPVTDDMTPVDVFFKFFDDELTDLLVSQTNRYATRQIDQHLTPHFRLDFYIK